MKTAGKEKSEYLDKQAVSSNLNFRTSLSSQRTRKETHQQDRNFKKITALSYPNAVKKIVALSSPMTPKPRIFPSLSCNEVFLPSLLECYQRRLIGKSRLSPPCSYNEDTPPSTSLSQVVYVEAQGRTRNPISEQK